MTCMCGDTECQSCGLAQGTLAGDSGLSEHGASNSRHLSTAEDAMLNKALFASAQRIDPETSK